MDAQALGRYLRETREARELTLDQAEQALRIRRRILESFETGEFNLPEFAPLQIRGFIRNYARYLGLEEDRLVAYYEAALVEGSSPQRKLSGRKSAAKRKDKQRETSSLTAPRKITDTPPALPPVVIPASVGAGFKPALAPAENRRGVSLFTLLIRLLVAVAALTVIAYVVVQLMETEYPTNPTPENDIFAPLLAGTPTLTLQPTLQSQELLLLPTTPPNLQPNFTGQGVLVTLVADERTWLRVSVDGTDQYVGIAPPGTSLEYPAGDNVTVVASNAQALDVVFNGQQQPGFGMRGQLVTVVFSRSGVQISSGPGYEPTPIESPTPLPTPTDPAGALVAQLTPTDTPGPSPTPSETPTETPIPSDTPIPSETPIPSDTPTLTLTPTETLTPSLTPTFTLTPTLTLTPSNTPVPSDTPIPTATSILPPRGIPPGATPTKVGG